MEGSFRVILLHVHRCMPVYTFTESMESEQEEMRLYELCPSPFYDVPPGDGEEGCTRCHGNLEKNITSRERP